MSSPGVSEIWQKFKKHTKEPNKEQSRAAKKKLAMEFNMNIIFSNLNNNADGWFKLHRYTEVCFFICTTMGNCPLITGIAIRVSVSSQLFCMSSYFKSSFFFGRFCFLDNRSDRCSTVPYTYVERYTVNSLQDGHLWDRH